LNSAPNVGCPDSSERNIVVNALPKVDLGPDTFYCSTDSFLLDAGNGFSNYSWTPNIGVGQIVYAKSSNNYSVIVTDVNGCNTTDNIIITQQQSPTPTISGNTIVCEDSSTMITGNGSGGTLAWTGITPFVNPLPVTTGGKYTITETDPNGCIGSADYNVTFESAPAINLGGPYTFCDGTTSTITLDAITGGVNETYKWSDSSTDPTLTVTSISTSEISVIVTSKNGCLGNDTAEINVINAPIVNLGGTASYCVGDSVELNAGTGFVSYSWKPNNEGTASIFAKTAGKYSVSVVNANGCVGVDTVDRYFLL